MLVSFFEEKKKNKQIQEKGWVSRPILYDTLPLIYEETKKTKTITTQKLSNA